ncbi:MAG: PHP domain-containing protein [Candidatus Diapherotrites archaeon]|nr:PHP domain-containing protein [Candidatus Diapherotrites archaeon]
MGKFDLHLHSLHSADALPKPESIAKQALKQGLAGFAITDHNSTAAFAEFKKLQKQNRKLLIVLGEEVKIIENEKCAGELLCYFLQEEIKPASFGEILDSAKEQDALTSIAHPFDIRRAGFAKDLGKEFRKVDAIEVFNGRACDKEVNEKAASFIEKHKFPFTAGSDAHSLGEIGLAGVECNAKNKEELRKAILKRKCKVFGSETTSAFNQAIISAKARIGGKEK